MILPVLLPLVLLRALTQLFRAEMLWRSRLRILRENTPEAACAALCMTFKRARALIPSRSEYDWSSCDAQHYTLTTSGHDLLAYL